MELGKVIEFRKDLYFEGAVQADWFYNPEKASKVAENFVFHGKQYFSGDEQSSGNRRRIDTISLVEELATKMNDEHSNALTLAIADYGTGKSHLAVTLGQILSGNSYMPDTYDKVLSNIQAIDGDAADRIKSLTDEPNFVMVINGMRDFNLHSEILKAAQKSLNLYGLSDEVLRKLNRALETANIFFERNYSSLLSKFEESAKKLGWGETGDALVSKIRENLMTDDVAFEIINSVYSEINGQEIKWDEGLSASNILEMIISEYCGMNGRFEHVIILFDEFGRYLEYASGVNAAKSGDSALQQIFETAQNAEGTLQVINFIQSDIKTYLQRVDQTKNISRYIGRYDASDKYYISSNLETVFANLIQRVDKSAFDDIVVKWQKSNEALWRDMFEKINKWVITKGLWKEYSVFRNVVIEGIYPMHPLSTFMLTQLSDYLQNRSSLTLISHYIEECKDMSISDDGYLVMPEVLMRGDLYTEMLAAEQEGKQPSQQCIKFDNIFRKFGDKLSEKSMMILRSNLILRILRFRTSDYEDAKNAISFCSGLSIQEIDEELNWLENEYAVLGFDEHAGCFDFMEESNGAHDFKVLKKRLVAAASIDKSYLQNIKVQEIAGIFEPMTTNFAIQHKIATNEWIFKQELYSVEDFSELKVKMYLDEWNNAISSTAAKGRLVWLYVNKDTDPEYVEKAKIISTPLKDKPIILMVINDDDNRLYNSLLEYSVLDSMDEVNRKKYERHFLDDYKQAENNIKDEFDELKKKRLLLYSEGIQEVKTRMPVYLTSVFDRIYPYAVAFWFDGFVTKGNNIGGKGGSYYCTIIKMLLSNSVNDVTIHNFSSDIRNRIEAVLMTTASTSWKCINEQYRVIPPENEAARRVYDYIVGELNEKKELSCAELFETLSAPPYGLSEDIITLMISVVCANMGYCLRFRYNDEIININSWKDIVVIKDKKIDIEVVRKSTIIVVDAGAVTGKYARFFERVQNNKKITEVHSLERILENMTHSDEVPEELETAYLLVKKTLDSGKKAYNQWSDKIAEIENKLEDALEDRNLYNALVGLELLRDIPYKSIFDDNGYKIDDESKEKVSGLKKELDDAVDELIDLHLSNMYCKSVEGVNTFRNHNTKIQNKLFELGYIDYSNKVREQKEKELNNIEEIKSRQELRDDCNKFFESSIITQYTTYLKICADLKQGKDLQTRVEKYKRELGKDAASIIDSLNSRVAELEAQKNKTAKDMSDIWDDLFDVKSSDDIEDLLQRITIVLQKGISETDQEDFTELSNNLNELLEDINGVKTATDSRTAFKSNSEKVLKKYEESDFDFEVLPILEEVISEIEKTLNDKEEKWKEDNLSLGTKSRKDVHVWKDRTKFLPDYLSDDTLAKVKELDSEADEIISEGKIEDVLFYFDKLNNKEQKECLEKLSSRVNE